MSSITSPGIPIGDESADFYLVDQTGRRFHLRTADIFASGSQGELYRTEQDVVVKIYHTEQSSDQVEKLKKIAALVLASPLLRKHCLIPRPVYREKRFVGCWMPFVEGIALDALEYCPFAFIQQHKLKPAVLFAIALSIAQIVGACHRTGILLPDLKGSNMILTPLGEIFLIDLDGATLPGLNCQPPRPAYRLTKRSFSTPYQEDLETDRGILFALIFAFVFNIPIHFALQEQNRLIRLPSGFCQEQYQRSDLSLRALYENRVQKRVNIFPTAEEYIEPLRLSIRRAVQFDASHAIRAPDPLILQQDQPSSTCEPSGASNRMIAWAVLAGILGLIIILTLLMLITR